MAIPASFDSATGALTGDNLDNTIATGRDAARPTPSLRDDPDAGGQIQSAVHQPTPSLRSDPDDGGQIQSALHRPAPSLRERPRRRRPDPERRAAADPQPPGRPRLRRPDPERRAPADPQPPGRPRRRRPNPERHAAADAQPPGRPRRRRPDPKCRAAVCGRPAPSTASDMAGASDQLLMLGATSRLVQATASFSAAGAADTSTTLPLGAETSQPSFLTTPQHP